MIEKRKVRIYNSCRKISDYQEPPLEAGDLPSGDSPPEAGAGDFSGSRRFTGGVFGESEVRF